MSCKCWICLKNFETPQGRGSHLANIGSRNPMYEIGEEHPLHGTEVSSERAEKISESMTGKLKGRTSPMKGKQFPDSGKIKLSESNSGEKNPMFDDWSSREEYPPEWNDDLKEFIRQLYCHTCQLCGKKQKSPRLDVHHMDGNKNNTTINNLFPFCRSCHHKMEALQW